MSTAACVKERPILFSGPMIAAILDGRKTQTRRTAKRLPCDDFTHADRIFDPDAGREFWRLSLSDGGACQTWNVDCPYGVPGDRLWVRETWAELLFWSDDVPVVEKVDAKGSQAHILYRVDCPDFEWQDGDEYPDVRADGTPASHWRPSIFMPRWASRLTLEITGVRVERVDSISTEDAIAEGFESAADFWNTFYVLNERAPANTNPWVWVVEFRRVEP